MLLKRIKSRHTTIIYNLDKVVADANSAVAAAANLRRPDKKGCTPMFHACSNGNLEEAKRLFNQCAAADITVRNKKEVSPMLAACSKGHLHIAKWLWVNGAEDDACQIVKGKKGPQWMACFNGHLDVVVWLSKQVGDDENLVLLNKDGMAPIHQACSKGHIKIVEWLICYMNKAKKLDEVVDNLKTEEDAHDAQAQGETKSETRSETKSETKSETVEPSYGLVEVCSNNSMSMLRSQTLQIKAKKAKKEAKRAKKIAKNRTQLTRIKMKKKGHTTSPMALASKHGHLNIMKLLFANGAKNDIHQNEKGKSVPLSEACRNGHVNALQWLIDNGASFRMKGSTGVTPMMRACEHGHLDIVQCLLNNGASEKDIRAISKKGTTPLIIAIENGHLNCVQLLCENGAREDIRKGKSVVYFNLKSRKSEKMVSTSMRHACVSGHLHIVRYLFNNGCEMDIHTEFVNGETLMFELCGDTQNIPILQWLLDNGAGNQLRSVNNHGTTPLSNACEHEALKTVQWLCTIGGLSGDINKACDGLACDDMMHDSTTPLSIACEESYSMPKIVKWWINRGMLSENNNDVSTIIDCLPHNSTCIDEVLEQATESRDIDHDSFLTLVCISKFCLNCVGSNVLHIPLILNLIGEYTQGRSETRAFWYHLDSQWLVSQVERGLVTSTEEEVYSDDYVEDY
jgi:ankyrin repeat protein